MTDLAQPFAGHPEFDELVAFLKARLKEDEGYARNAFADHNDAGPNWYEQWSGALNIGEDEDLVMTNDSQVSRFMARHDPARVLREVEAGRRILLDYEDAMRTLAAAGTSGTPFDIMTGATNTLKRMIRLRAQSYADHPEYRPEWAP